MQSRDLHSIVPGLFLSGLFAASARYMSDSLGGPAMLYALLVGMAFHFLSEDRRLEKGIQFASQRILRLGVALLGARIAVGDLLDVGWPVIVLVVSGVALCIVAGQFAGRCCRLEKYHALLSAGAVAICGASATLAIASVLPTRPNQERDTILTVAIVTAMSTLVMILYPILVTVLHFNDTLAGVFLGATIHDVAQVVGAGYMVSEETGDISTMIKLLRVACLIPVVFSISIVLRLRGAANSQTMPVFPCFLVVFVALVVVNSLGWIPPNVRDILTPISGSCLLTAVAALGLKTELKALVEIGARPVVAMFVQTGFLAAFIISGLLILDSS